jgi:hypothetical protein
MYLGNDVGPHQAQQLVVALDILVVVSETLPTEIRLGQLVLLDHRSHGPIQDQDALAQLLNETRTMRVVGDRIGEIGIRHGFFALYQ